MPVITNPQKIAEELRKPEPVVVFSTYHSSPQIATAFKLGDVPEFDFIIVDEAHHVALEMRTAFATVLDKDKIPGKKRLFMTATQRFYNAENVLEPASEVDFILASMDDEDKFGPVFHAIPLGEAIKRGLLSDYQLVIVGVTQDDSALGQVLLNETKQGRFVLLPGAEVKPKLPNLRTVGMQIAMIRAMPKYDLYSTIAYHSLVKRSEKWVPSFKEVNACLPAEERIENLTVAHLDSGNSTFERQKALAHLRNPDKDEYAVVSNVRLFGEGIDVPNLSAVAIIDPKGSTIDIVQTIGRVLRLDPDDPDKVGTILLPVFVDANDNDTPSAIAKSLYEPIHQVLMVLRNEDERFAEEINSVRIGVPEPPNGGYEPSVGLKHVKAIDIPHITEDILRAFEARMVERLYVSFSFWVELIKQHQEEIGYAIPTKKDGAVYMYKGHALGNVANIFRTWAKKKKLSPARIAELDAIGFQWAPFDEQWEEGLLETVAYRNEHGELPTSGPDARWLQLQRSAKNLAADRKERLDKQLPEWSLSARDVKWEANRQEVLKFDNEHGYLPPQNYVVQHPTLGKISPGTWMTSQRMHYPDKLGPKRTALLEEITHWTWDTGKAKWMEKWGRLRSFEEENGHTSIPKNYPDKALIAWVAVQRKEYEAETLSDERIAQLESLKTWEWEPKGKGSRPTLPSGRGCWVSFAPSRRSSATPASLGLIRTRSSSVGVRISVRLGGTRSSVGSRSSATTRSHSWKVLTPGSGSAREAARRPPDQVTDSGCRAHFGRQFIFQNGNCVLDRGSLVIANHVVPLRIDSTGVQPRPFQFAFRLRNGSRCVPIHLESHQFQFALPTTPRRRFHALQLTVGILDFHSCSPRAHWILLGRLLYRDA